MQALDSILTLFIVAAASFYVIKKFFSGAGCSGCSCGRGGDSFDTEGSDISANEPVGGRKNYYKRSRCKCSGD